MMFRSLYRREQFYSMEMQGRIDKIVDQLLNNNKMSKKVEKPAKSGEKEKKGAAFPVCANNKEARMVCLSDSCESYPFFCSNCEDSSCETPHQHDDDKLVSVSYKQFTKRVLRERKPCDTLGDAISSYREILEKLKANVSEFIQKELSSLEEIESKSAEIEPEDEELIQKLKSQQFKEFTGSMMDQLWKNCAEDPAKKKEEEEKGEFMKIKEEEVKGISEHFEHLNKLGLDNVQEQEEEKEKEKEKPVNQNSNSQKTKK